ncbi:MAG: anti-sigma factor family protein [Phycisphaerae bacterium]
MNCQEVRKFLFAFADGQISVQANCEVLDHLKMCPICSAVVDEHQAVHQAIRTSAERIPVPARLRDRVRMTLQLGRPVRRHEVPRRTVDGRLWRIVALAACITLVVTVAWQMLPSSTPGGLNPFGGRGQVSASDRSDTAQLVVVRHNRCSLDCDRQVHHNIELSYDPESVAQEIRDHFKGRLLAIAPDLSHHGYEFDSANYCCITRDKDCMAGHVMYVDPRFGTRLSLFSMSHWDDINPIGDENPPPDKDHPFVHSVPLCETNISIVAWHEGNATYVCCGPLTPEDMREMVDDIRVALADPERREKLAAAFNDNVKH